jgi:hypothetical protein
MFNKHVVYQMDARVSRFGGHYPYLDPVATVMYVKAYRKPKGQLTVADLVSFHLPYICVHLDAMSTIPRASPAAALTRVENERRLV